MEKNMPEFEAIDEYLMKRKVEEEYNDDVDKKVEELVRRVDKIIDKRIALIKVKIAAEKDKDNPTTASMNPIQYHHSQRSRTLSASMINKNFKENLLSKPRVKSERLNEETGQPKKIDTSGKSMKQSKAKKLKNCFWL